MLSIDFIRKNKDKVKKAAKNKNRQVDIDKILQLDYDRRQVIKKIQEYRESRNKLSDLESPNLRPSLKKQDITVREKVRKIKVEIKTLEANLSTIELQLTNLLSYVPNIPLDETPVGKDASSNREIRKWGKIPKFDFQPKTHIELGEKLDIIDFVRGAKVSGFRGYFLKNEAAQLQFAILWYTFNKLIEKGYTPIIAPAVIKEFSLFGSGQFPWGKQDTYQLNDDDAFLAGTAEQPVTAYYANEILNEKELPKKFVAFSPCFRKEAGAYGKDTKGLYRLHEFWKVEQVIMAKNNLEAARKLHEELQKNCEEILHELQLPYRVVILSTAEMGEPQLFKYDTEVWMPSRNNYGETMSNSIMGDFQTRRLNIKYRTKDNKIEYCYSLNNTAIASPRILIAVLENYQQKDGSILIPKILQQLVGKVKIVSKK